MGMEVLSGADSLEDAVRFRYGSAARRVEEGLCCPAEYDRGLLDLLPRELVEKDYGCGDPTRFVVRGETVVDLGSGSGKICYMLAKRVGPEGSVIGVDFNDEMLALSRRHLDEMAEKLGYRNVRFVKGKIQDLALDLELAQSWLADHPITTVEEMSSYDAECRRLRQEETLIPDASVDVVVSNCVLNLVRHDHKRRLFSEIHRVLRRGGRAVISDIVCDEDPTPSMKADPELWSGCISGAFREDRFLDMFEAAGFYGVEMLSRQEEPWQVIEGIEFRSVTVRAFKGKEGPCLDRNQAVTYKGPWKTVCDDDGHTFHRGRRMAVCDKTFSLMTDPCGPYGDSIIAVPPRVEIPPEEAAPFDCDTDAFRHPRESKGTEYRPTVTNDGPPCECGPKGC